VELKGLPPANNKTFRFVDEALLAKVVSNTFKVKVDKTGCTCAIFPAANKKGRRSGHIEVPPKVANAIAAKLEKGTKLELICGPKKKPKVRCTQYITVCQLRLFTHVRAL
jgi:hypothetical protein